MQIPSNTSEYIKNYIQDFEASQLRQKMRYGEDYYRSKNTEIMSRKMYIYTEDKDGIPLEMEDPYKANNKLPAGYMKILVDQKLNYVLGKPITLETEQQDELTETLGKKFQTTLKQIGKEASKKAIAWGHVYIDNYGNFKLMKVPSEQVIPVYSSYDDEQLEKVIRYYAVTTLNESNQVVQVNRVEVWDKEQVTYYQENTASGEYDLLNEEDMFNIFGKPYSNPKYHFQKDIKYGEVTARTEGLSWGDIPFIPLYNNDEEENDLNPVKAFIDAYDIVNSDFVNNLEDFQDVYWILKGYNGENIGKFLDQVKRYKTLKVGEGGDARAETIQIPYEARREAKEGLEKDIFTFGMGVNPNAVGDGNITNVVIKARFANLDLKASQFEQEVKDFIDKLMYFVNRYREINGQSEIILDDIVFNRSMMVNEVELLTANATQNGFISQKTRLSNHPWVSDTEEEIEMLEEESSINLDNVNLEEEKNNEN